MGKKDLLEEFHLPSFPFVKYSDEYDDHAEGDHYAHHHPGRVWVNSGPRVWVWIAGFIITNREHRGVSGKSKSKWVVFICSYFPPLYSEKHIRVAPGLPVSNMLINAGYSEYTPHSVSLYNYQDTKLFNIQK